MNNNKKNWSMFASSVFLAVIVFGVLTYLFASGRNTVQPSPADTGKTETETPKPQTHLMNISGFAFAKATITVTTGSTVKWTNKDSAPHTVTSTSGSELASGELGLGDMYPHTFKKAGVYAYFCAYHPSMKGTVVVK